MIKHLLTIKSDNHDPRYNLALEMVLFETLPKDSMILYLWQNANTIVIGKNQNAWKECNLHALDEDNVTLVRRSSGGGAVFHDLGNLCFTFITEDSNYSIERQSNIILDALRPFGIHGELSGRNDLLVDERKFSGNAYYHHGGKAFQHGTLLIDTDLTKMSRYLNVDTSKLEAKGISSVKSRVINLIELNPDLSIPEIQKELVKAAEKDLGLKAEEIKEVDEKSLQEKFELYSSDAWIYGNRIGFNYSFGKRFGWGDIQFELFVQEKKIKECNVWSDAMDNDFIESLKNSLIGCDFTNEELCNKVRELGNTDMVKDVVSLIQEQTF